MEDVRKRFEKGNRILFRKTDPILIPLSDTLATENRRVVVLWAFSLVNEPVAYLFARYPDVKIFVEAVDTVHAWAEGREKMPAARRAILALHNTASFIEDESDVALIHAVGQALSTVHTKKHAMGFVIYELTSIVREHGLDEGLMLVPERIQYYYDKLDEARKLEKENRNPWADFMLNDI